MLLEYARALPEFGHRRIPVAALADGELQRVGPGRGVAQHDKDGRKQQPGTEARHGAFSACLFCTRVTICSGRNGAVRNLSPTAS